MAHVIVGLARDTGRVALPLASLPAPFKRCALCRLTPAATERDNTGPAPCPAVIPPQTALPARPNYPPTVESTAAAAHHYRYASPSDAPSPLLLSRSAHRQTSSPSNSADDNNPGSLDQHSEQDPNERLGDVED
eukprot:CAMPEP_0181190130 /NCGR_PEP_ID=MMETSP1096-20121128/12026_1 /TAXON_ID=156174 ORGANISM="Chrysochromulina ericina, Strain CCMP281" /NCGR_SAMPLE_ID=MMETSP1096 /ASSEMBLY_ACC=CAM_ASM_000453 /LENGTH=133 /DNA_ID=CAMNT_0023279319 /DNA_START=367 /DNA_END=769 /DNA_ORIENTATION=+